MTTEFFVADGLPFVIVRRAFRAPRELVYKAHLDPELLVQWLGPRELITVVEEHDPRDGGRWRYRQFASTGEAFVFHGVFHGDPSPERVVQTFEYSGAPNRVKLDTTTFAIDGEFTVVKTASVFQSLEDRDGMVATGMQRGLTESTDRLTELLVLHARALAGEPKLDPTGQPSEKEG